MRKKILCLVMAAVMTAGTSLPVFAEHIQGSKDWMVDFDGNKMNSNFDSTEMKSEIYRLLPGDTIELQVGVKNSGADDTDWYMTNEILQSLEESQSVAEDGAYTYHLTYVDHNNESTVLYSSDTVGGEGTEEAGEGLHQATDSLEEYFYLDRLEQGETGAVHLTIALDGETQGNAYQDTLAKLQMNFAVEKVAPEKEIQYKPGETTTLTRKKRNVIRTSPKTGDTTKILAFCAVAMVSGLVLLFLGIRIFRRNQEDGKENGKNDKN